MSSSSHWLTKSGKGRLETIYCTIIFAIFAIGFSHFIGKKPTFLRHFSVHSARCRKNGRQANARMAFFALRVASALGD